MPRDELEQLELRLLLEALYESSGYDFREYARTSLHRRIWRRVIQEGLHTLSGLQEQVLHDPACLERLLGDLAVTVTAMFRDPAYYKVLRQEVVPILRTYPFVRVWNAGCSTGEETLSLAILLREAGLAARTRIYATDMNGRVVSAARQAALPLDRMREYTENYIRSGGTEAFSDYYAVRDDSVRFDPTLLDNIVFAQHNLVSDAAFNEFHLIVCRNVLIYFDPSLQQKVHDLFHHSLVRFGILALGHKESLRLTPHAESYEALDAEHKVFRRVA
ncbi:MAG: CheR family methyltransferase [Acidimicrobiales bacterium]